MGRRTRYTYTPREAGWVAVLDPTRAPLAAIDCSNGGAQQAYDRKCKEMEAEGWMLEDRFADSRFAHRGTERVEISIMVYDPYGPPPQSHSIGKHGPESFG